MRKIEKFFYTGVGILGITFLALLNDDTNEKYSNKWFDKLSDEELENEREAVRQEWCSPKGSDRTQKLLVRFDKEISKRKWNHVDGSDYKYPKKREHGWYIPNDED